MDKAMSSGAGACHGEAAAVEGRIRWREDDGG